MTKRNKTPAAVVDATPAAQFYKVDATPAAQVEIKENRSVVPRRWRTQYAANALKGTCGDQVAKAFAEALKTKTLEEIGMLNSIDVSARWGARNVGMQRMNLGNVLRGMAKRGEEVRF